MAEDIPTTAINMERSPSPLLKRGIQFFHPGRSEIIIANMIEDTHAAAINLERSPSHSLKRGIKEVETSTPCDGNLSPLESVKRSKTEHAQENGNITDDKAMTVKPRSILRPRNSNYVTSEILASPLDRLNNQENSEETQLTKRKSVHWDPDIDSDQTLWIKEKSTKRQHRAKRCAKSSFSVTFTDDEWRDFVKGDLGQALKSAPEEMINEIVSHLVPEQSSTLKFITKRVQDESEDEVTIFTDSAALLRLRRELLLALEPYFGMQYILCGSCETLHRPCHCCSNIGYIVEPCPANMCPSRFLVCNYRRQWNALSLKKIDFAHTQYGMKCERRNLKHKEFDPLKLPRTTLFHGVDKTYKVIQFNEIFIAEERGVRLLHRKQDWFFGTGEDIKMLETAVRGALWLKGAASLQPYPGVCRHFKRKDLHISLLHFFASIPGPSKLYRCDECALEWQIDITDIKTQYSSGLALVFTVWRDLGRFLSPFDPRWTAHFEEYEGDEYKREFGHLHDEMEPNKGWREDEEPINDWAVGGIRKAFEMDEDWKLDVESCLGRKQLKLLTDLSDPDEF